jgi:glycosyltransferase involved in cell wall biosynthesis
MKTALHPNISAKRYSDKISSSIKVCIHILRPARSDVRSIRDAKALTQIGYDVTIIDVEEESRPPLEIAQGVSVHRIIVPNWRGFRRFEILFFFKMLQVFLLSIYYLLRADADIYHACDITALPACYIVAKLRHKPLIYEAYELPLYDVPLSEMGAVRRVFHRMFAQMLPHLISACAAVITVSQPIVEEIKRSYHKENVALVRNMLPYCTVVRTNRLREHLGLASHVQIALYQGYLQPDRGLDLLVRAAPLINSDIVIVMMGKGIGNTQAHLEELIREFNVADRVKIIPPVPYEELLEWTASADIGLTLIPLDYTLNMKLCLPNKLFEFIMAGLPVLSAPLEAITEIITRYDVGCVVPSLSSENVAYGINSLMADPIKRMRMHENALQAAQELCWEKESENLLQVYNVISSL